MDKREKFRKFSNSLLGYALDVLFGNDAKDKVTNLLVVIVLIIIFLLFGLLIYVGAETVVLLTRTKLGSKGVGKGKAIFSAIIFLVLSYICYKFYNNDYSIALSMGSNLSFFLGSITFLFVSIVVFIRGITAGGKDDNDVIDPIYRGNSWLLGGLTKEGWSQSLVQDVAEPFLFLGLGVYLASFNYIWGLPFVFCAISCWLHLGIEAAFGFFDERKELSNEGLVYTQNRRVSKILN